MIEAELALALSPRRWSDELRRFLADHGGARVRVTAIGPEDLWDESFHVLIIDDICSFLTPRLVARVLAAGHGVIGVFDASEFPEGAAMLRECGISEVIEADSHPDEFLAAVGRLADRSSDSPADGPGQVAGQEPSKQASGRIVAVAGPGGGPGVTEVAIALAGSLHRVGRSVVLVDGDDAAPAVAQRLGLDLFPNVRTAVDVVEQRSAEVSGALQGGVGPSVLVGMPGADEWRDLRPAQVVDVVEELSLTFDHVVVDAGNHAFSCRGAGGASRFLVERADAIVFVGSPSPVGIGRSLHWLSKAARAGNGSTIDMAVNRAPRDPFRRGEIIEEITRSFAPASLELLPEDPAVAAAAWDGVAVARGRFRKAVDRWVAHLPTVVGP